MKCTVKLSSHNTNYCLIEVVTKADFTVSMFLWLSSPCILYSNIKFYGILPLGPLLPWSYDNWIYIYLFNQCQSPSKVLFQPVMRYTWYNFCDKVRQTVWWFSAGLQFPPLIIAKLPWIAYITAVLFKVVLNTHNQKIVIN
jgi:hypothetical protein